MNAEKKFMDLAINEARYNAISDYPIGAVVVRGQEVLATGRNIVRSTNDPTNHAEIDAIRKATKKVGSVFLEGCILYTTLEPCAMCAAAAIWAKLDGIVYGASMEDAIKFSKTRGNISLSYRQIMVKCRDILDKSETKLLLVENFEREECIKLFELTK